MKQPSETIAKKPYQSPKLLVYGDLKDMTKALGTKGNVDGGHAARKNRTGK